MPKVDEGSGAQKGTGIGERWICAAVHGPLPGGGTPRIFQSGGDLRKKIAALQYERRILQTAEAKSMTPFSKNHGKGRSHRPNAGALCDPKAESARIAKVMARAGLCSRRDAEAWIAAGRVDVNGIRLKSPARNVSPCDSIFVDGQPLARRERTRLFLFHKPRGLLTTNRDPQNRPTIFSVLPKELPRLVAVGRLDINSEGLLLLTNDGGLARVLELPATGWIRRYRVRAKGTTDQSALDSLREGLTLDGVDYAGTVATLDRVQGANVWLTMALSEGKNREVRRVLEHLGLAVNRLIRISYGPFQLGTLAEGAVAEVRTRVLREQLGRTLAEEARVDFGGPVVASAGTVEKERRRNKTGGSRSKNGRPAGAYQSSSRNRGAEGSFHRERGGEAGEPAPRRDRPKPGPRRHVSVLRRARAAANEEKGTPRRRVARTETADRKGRAVTIERIGAQPEQADFPSRKGRRSARWEGAARRGRGGKPRGQS